MLQTRDYDYVAQAHSHESKKPSSAFRKADGETPYYMHPFWCATMFLTEHSLPKQFRLDGAVSLIYHDILEDTDSALPEWLTPRQVRLVGDLTFPGPSAIEMKQVWGKKPEIRLLKLVDKLSNLLDGTWMTSEKRNVYEEYTARLLEDSKQNFGELNITRIAEGYLESSLIRQQ